MLEVLYSCLLLMLSRAAFLSCSSNYKNIKKTPQKSIDSEVILSIIVIHVGNYAKTGKTIHGKVQNVQCAMSNA